MDNPTGTVQTLLGGAEAPRAVVLVDDIVACPRCAAGQGCGAGLLIGATQARRVEVSLAADMPLATGDRVELVLAAGKVLRATLIVYGLPLLGALIAAAVAFLLAWGDTVAVLAAIGGLSAGMLAGRHLLRRGACLQNFVPRVGKRLQPGTSGR
jgi:sigma-E factor negative regulatory protein RseC